MSHRNGKPKPSASKRTISRYHVRLRIKEGDKID